jgi:putative DNA methylase
MVWDFADVNPFSSSTGNFLDNVGWVAEALDSAPVSRAGTAVQADAASPFLGARASRPQALGTSAHPVVSTDPPYYDNIGYADLSDFFYVWLRRSLHGVFPELFATVAVPKAEELVATPYRHGSREKAERFFLDGMTKAMGRLAEQAHPAFPVTIYYAFKQAETPGTPGARGTLGTRALGARASGPPDDEEEKGARASGPPRQEADQRSAHPSAHPKPAGVVSTGWETFLDAVIRAGFSVTGTLPMRTERSVRTIGLGTNALASSIVLVCRQRADDAPTATRAEFLQELSFAMREALPLMTNGQIAPVDLAQASIGPGMAVYSKYSRVLRQDGKPVTVREALQDINNAISAYRTERTSSFDPKTRFCLDFYEQFGFAQGEFDNATVLARAQAVGVDTLENEHLLVAERGKAWLVPLKAYPVGVDGLERAFAGSAWEACMRLAVTLQEKGDGETAALARQLGEGVCARARELAVWLYTIADARKRAEDALAFNALDASWPEIQRLMASMAQGEQGRFA